MEALAIDTSSCHCHIRYPGINRGWENRFINPSVIQGAGHIAKLYRRIVDFGARGRSGFEDLT
jgi:hypothetical protein